MAQASPPSRPVSARHAFPCPASDRLPLGMATRTFLACVVARSGEGWTRSMESSVGSVGQRSNARAAAPRHSLPPFQGSVQARYAWNGVTTVAHSESEHLHTRNVGFR